ncbi:DUF411 domain-containing protein [Nitrobacter sp. 62-13]|nr:DUF411 domain-containing protein [Nitrobacter sp. 62-13]
MVLSSCRRQSPSPGAAADLAACHTVVGGYVLEGHVPA